MGNPAPGVNKIRENMMGVESWQSKEEQALTMRLQDTFDACPFCLASAGNLYAMRDNRSKYGDGKMRAYCKRCKEFAEEIDGEFWGD